MEEPVENQTLKQKKIACAQSEHASVFLELLKDCTTQIIDIVGETEFKTVVNAITIEVETKMRLKVATYIEQIKSGKLHESGE